MSVYDQLAYSDFIAKYRKKFRSISSKTNGEYTFDDVVGEAWLMACVLEERKGIEVNFRDQDFQSLLMSHLYQQLVVYTDKKVRTAVQLDHAPKGIEMEDVPHPLMRKLAASSDSEPELLLAKLEADQVEEEALGYNHSQAGAYVQLFRRFDNRIAAVAEYLLISISCVRKHYAEVLELAQRQYSLPWPAWSEPQFPRPWRRSRISSSSKVCAKSDGDAGSPLFSSHPI